jgi:hypothetical protein
MHMLEQHTLPIQLGQKRKTSFLLKTSIFQLKGHSLAVFLSDLWSQKIGPEFFGYSPQTIIEDPSILMKIPFLFSSIDRGKDTLVSISLFNREDYEGYPLGTMIKKEIPIRMNLSCVSIRRKEYKGINYCIQLFSMDTFSGYGLLHYFMLEGQIL